VLPFFGPTHELAARGRSPFTLIHPFEWRTQCEAALARDALYPLRPDSCVAFADVGGTLGPIDCYFIARGIWLD
jgi:hypothetical protein